MNHNILAPQWMYERTPSLAKAWDWLESAYNNASPWIHTAMKIG